MRVFGNFCWGGNAQQAEIYMVPKNQATPASLSGGSIADAKAAQKTLIEAGMRGKAVTAGDSVVEFDLPNTDKFLVGKGDTQTARLVIYDNKARRTSAVTADKIITLRAKDAPFPILLIGGVTFGGVVLVLLVVNLLRGGGGGKRGRAAAPMATPRPIVAGAGGGGFAPAPIVAAPMGGGMPDVYGGGGPSNATRATLTGGVGIFTVLPGMEMRAGRDGAACQILLVEPRVSGVHAVVKLEGGQLVVRDEGSNNGTFVNGARIPGMTWTPVPNGAALKFGPVEFSVRLE